jgi:hypothetical protein
VAVPDVLAANLLSLELPDATAPVSLGGSFDARRLGVALHWWGLGRGVLADARRQPRASPRDILHRME